VRRSSLHRRSISYRVLMGGRDRILFRRGSGTRFRRSGHILFSFPEDLSRDPSLQFCILDDQTVPFSPSYLGRQILFLFTPFASINASSFFFFLCLLSNEMRSLLPLSHWPQVTCPFFRLPRLSWASHLVPSAPGFPVLTAGRSLIDLP